MDTRAYLGTAMVTAGNSSTKNQRYMISLTDDSTRVGLHRRFAAALRETLSQYVRVDVRHKTVRSSDPPDVNITYL